MLRFAIFIVTLLFLVSCSSTNEDKNTAKNKFAVEISVTKDSVKVGVKPKSKHKLLLIARGSEPGWYAEFFTDHLRLLINNGTDSLHLDEDFSDITSKEEYKKTIIQANSSNDNTGSLSVVIKIEPKQCTEANGDIKEKSISLRYNNQNFKGCAHSENN